MLPDTVIRIRVGPAQVVLPAYMAFALRADRVQYAWKGQKVGLAAAQVNVNSTIVKSTRVALPPLSEQRVISERIYDLTDVLDRQRQELDKLKTLKQGLLQDLLTGKVRVSV